MGWALSLARLWGLIVAGLLFAWAFTFKSSFLPRTSGDGDAISQLNRVFSALHPLLMVIGLILLNGEAILVHRRLTGWSRATRNLVHLSLQASALVLGLFGIWSKFKGKQGIAANFYSLHSWIGIACLALFVSQWVVGFITMWHKGERRRAQSVILPWHIFTGLYTYGVAVAAAETGLQEKLTFLRGRRGGLARTSPESVLINSLGLALAVLSAAVTFAAVLPSHHGHGGGHAARCIAFKEASNGKYHVPLWLVNKEALKERKYVLWIQIVLVVNLTSAAETMRAASSDAPCLVGEVKYECHLVHAARPCFSLTGF